MLIPLKYLNCSCKAWRARCGYSTAHVGAMRLYTRADTMVYQPTDRFVSYRTGWFEELTRCMIASLYNTYPLHDCSSFYCRGRQHLCLACITWTCGSTAESIHLSSHFVNLIHITINLPITK
jgi:hypothetical protein